VTRLFESYESHRDVHQLLKDLQQATSAPARASASAPASSRQQESEVSSSPSPLLSSHDSQEEEEVESKFLSIVKKMNLTGEETAALREAISSDDPLLRSALELFRSDGNEKNLMTNLTTISKRILKTSPARRGAQQQATAAAKPKQKGNQAQEVRSVSPPIHDIFPILLKEFVKHEILTAENVAALQSLHQSKDEVLMAALNLYDLDHDLGGLVDALVKILKYV
jgi:ribosomal protein L12E/L44/L45/RPP1/RPP2